MPQGTSRQGSSRIRLGSVKLQLNISIPCLEPTAEPHSSRMLKAMSVEPVGFYRCIQPPAHHHAGFKFEQKHGVGYCVCGEIDMNTVVFNVKSW